MNILDSLTQASVLHEGAKVRVIMDELVVKHHNDVRLHQEVLRNQRRLIADLEGRIDELTLEICRLKESKTQDKVKLEENEKTLKELEAVVEILINSNKAGRESFVKHALTVK